VDETRRLKPTISMIGQHGIPIHDELDLVRPLTVADIVQEAG